MDNIPTLWTKKHRPKDLSTYIFQSEEQQNYFTNLIRKGEFAHLMLVGVRGTGKSAMAQLLIDSAVEAEDYDMDVLKLDGSTRNSVDDVRHDVLSHVTTYPQGKFKVVHLEEADRLSPEAQDALKDLMDQYSDGARFILTCNNQTRITAEIKSRCEITTFHAVPKPQSAAVAAKILTEEEIQFDFDTIAEHVNVCYPDMRALINSIHQCSTSGKLTPPISSDNLQAIGDIIDHIKHDRWLEIEKLAYSEISDAEWDTFYTVLYSNLKLSPKFGSSNDKYQQGLIKIRDYLVDHKSVARPNINASALTILLSRL